MFMKWFSRVMSFLLFVCSLLGINLGGKTAPAEMITYNRAKTEVTIALESNPSTGYDWAYESSDPSVIKMTNDQFFDGSNAGMVGAPGTRAITFKGLKEGTATVTFRYLRPWEDEAIRIVEIKIAVASDKTLSAEVISDTTAEAAD